MLRRGGVEELLVAAPEPEQQQVGHLGRQRRRRRNVGRRQRHGRMRGRPEVGARVGAAEEAGGLVVEARGLLGGVEPHADLLDRVLDLRHPPPRRPLPHADEPLPSSMLLLRRHRGHAATTRRPCARVHGDQRRRWVERVDSAVKVIDGLALLRHGRLIADQAQLEGRGY
jgi:hypothetical protein